MLNVGAGGGITKCRAALKTRPPVGTTRMKREESRAKGMENRKDRSIYSHIGSNLPTFYHSTPGR